jgi:hypothetical protein
VLDSHSVLLSGLQSLRCSWFLHEASRQIIVGCGVSPATQSMRSPRFYGYLSPEHPRDVENAEIAQRRSRDLCCNAPGLRDLVRKKV